MRDLSTGAAGFLGSHLADALLARGDAVVGIDNLLGGDRENVPQGVDFAEVDCNDLGRLRRAMRGAEVVVHCAATAHEGLSVFSPHENARHGYYASAAVFSAACAVGVRRVVHMSSLARYGKGDGPPPFNEAMQPMPEDPYGIGKYASELLLRNLAETHGLETVIAVPHNIYGPVQCFKDPFRNVVSIFANRMLQGRQPILYGDGLQERCFSYITDCIDPLVRMVTGTAAVGETINIGPDTEVVPIKRVAEIVAAELEFPLDPIFVKERPREVKFAHCSADKARRLLGYEPRVPLEEGIRKTVDWIRVRGARPFTYHHLGIEIDSPLLPETWGRRLM